MHAFALLLAAGPAAPPSPSEAELLLREMDATIAAAKTLRIEFEIRNDRPEKGEQLLKGSLVLGGRNRLRFEQAGWVTATAVSDGCRTAIVAPDEQRTRDTPDWFNDVLKGWLGRGGTYVSTAKAFDLLDRPSSGRPGPADGPRVTNSKVLADEQVGGVKCRVVEYELAWVEQPPASAETVRVRVWIDPRTKLPVRRTMTIPIGDGDRADSYTATHTKFEINPKLDDQLFELPK